MPIIFLLHMAKKTPDDDIALGLQVLGEFQQEGGIHPDMAQSLAAVFLGFRPEMSMGFGDPPEHIQNVLMRLGPVRFVPRRGEWSLVNLRAMRRVVHDNPNQFPSGPLRF